MVGQLKTGTPSDDVLNTGGYPETVAEDAPDDFINSIKAWEEAHKRQLRPQTRCPHCMPRRCPCCGRVLDWEPPYPWRPEPTYPPIVWCSAAAPREMYA